MSGVLETEAGGQAKIIPRVQIEDLDGKTTIQVEAEGPGQGPGQAPGAITERYGADFETDEEEEAKRKYKRFTVETYAMQVERAIEEKMKAEERASRLNDGYLENGELKFGNEGDEEEDQMEFDPFLQEGCNLPEDYPDFPKNLYGVPIEDIDHHIKETSFVVIARKMKKKSIFRFSSTSAFFLLAPWNPIRRACIYVATNQFFDYFIILTILVNCVFLALPEESNPWLSTSEYVFLAIYTIECIIKILARGFFVFKYTYMRDGWNWLDFFVVVISFLNLVLENALPNSNGVTGNIQGLRTFRVLRALKTVSIIPGLKTIIAALLKAFRFLIEVILLTFFCMMVFAMFALQVYAGMLRQKCVRDITDAVNVDDYTYAQYIKDTVNWHIADGADDYTICGNATYAGRCPTNYTCLPDIGDNPRFGYSNFDYFGWAMLNSFQLITLDFWEDPYNKILRANGPWNILFFIVVVFFGSYYLVNLMLAVVSMSYEEEVKTAGKEKEEEKRETKRKAEKEQAASYARKKRMEKKREAELKNAQNPNATAMQVMGAVGGGSSSKVPNASSKIAEGVGNGAVRGLKHLPTKDIKILSEASKSKKPENGKPNSIANNLTSESFANSLLNYDDNVSVKSDDNPGDAPRTSAKESESESSRSSSDTEDDEDDELVDRNCNCCSRCCRCYIPWLKAQNKLYKVVSDLIFELVITVCIALNVLIMAMSYHGMSKEYEKGLEIANYVFIGIFTLEAILKLMAMSQHYFKSGWNIFDFIIVVLSLIDIGLTGVQGLQVFRAFRLLRLMRVFKLAQTWSTMRRILAIIMSTLGALANVILVLAIIIYIFAIIGMQLFKNTYTKEVFGSDKPRWNFDDFGHSLILIFRVLCGEWIEPMWDCMLANGELCMVVFLPTLILGNFMVLNLFLALLLNAFASDTLKSEKGDKEDSKVKQGWRKIKKIFARRKNNQNAVVPGENRRPSIADLVQQLNLIAAEREAEEEESRRGTSNAGASQIAIESKEVVANGDAKKHAATNGNSPRQPEGKQGANLLTLPVVSKADGKSQGKAANADSNNKKDKKDEKDKSDKKTDEDDTNKEEEGEEEKPGKVEDFWPAAFYVKCKCLCCGGNWESAGWQRWMKFREYMHKITEHKAFEYFILLIIFASSTTLCFEDIYLYRNKTKEQVIYWLNFAFILIFILEMLMKWISLGFKKYFTTFWTILDFLIVVISVISLAIESTDAGEQIGSLRALRTLRALRPLRAISRWQGMRIVVNALVSAIPAIINVFLVCLVFWLIFSIAGVQLFQGKFYKCVDELGDKLNTSIVKNKQECKQQNYTWVNSKINFDNVPQGYLALLQVATFEGWMEIMEDAVDSRTEEGLQPKREANFPSYIFFVLFIVFGSFFALNLFIGVIIDNFNTLKKKYEGGFVDIFLTSSQKNYFNTMKKLGNKKPQKTIKRPKNTIQGFFFDVSVSTKFDLAIVILILLNMIAMAVEHYKQSRAYDEALDLMNIFFTTIFTLEAIVKIIGMRWHYFRRAWNVYDFIIVVVSIIGVILDDILRDVFITPTLLRVVRVFRIGRVLRLVKAAKGIRKLLFALVISLPALLNIGMLLTLVIFIYAIFGMTLFGTVKPTGTMDDVVNFQTFGSSMVLLFRLTTAGGWNEILGPLMITKADDRCNNTHMFMPDTGEAREVPNGECGSTGLAIFFMVTFILLTFLIMINMYIAVILENYTQAHEQEEVGVTEDDFEMFYLTWERYDPHATQFIKYDQLSDFVGDLEEPLGIPKPNEIALVAFNLSIYNGDRLHCLDILTSLVRNVLGSVEETEEFRQLKHQMDEKYKESFPTRVQQSVVSTTMKRKKEDVAAKTLQRAYKAHKAQANIRNIANQAMNKKKGERTRASVDFDASLKAGGSNAPRPQSPSATKTLNASTVAQKKKESTMGNVLQLPKAGDIQ